MLDLNAKNDGSYAASAFAGQDEQGADACVHTSWGTIHKIGPDAAVQKGVETALFAGSLLFYVLAVGLWFLSGTTLVSELFGVKLALTVIFGCIGFAFSSLAERGVGQQVHIDDMRGQIRLLWVNRLGENRLQSIVEFSELRSIFAQPVGRFGSKQQLALRAGRNAFVLPLWTGKKDVIARDIAHLSQRVERGLGDMKTWRDLSETADQAVGHLASPSE